MEPFFSIITHSQSGTKDALFFQNHLWITPFESDRILRVNTSPFTRHPEESILPILVIQNVNNITAFSFSRYIDTIGLNQTILDNVSFT